MIVIHAPVDTPPAAPEEHVALQAPEGVNAVVHERVTYAVIQGIVRLPIRLEDEIKGLLKEGFSYVKEEAVPKTLVEDDDHGA